MGQKVHPGGLRVGVIHDWKSNWYTGKKEFAAYILEDVRIRGHITGKLSHAGLSDILIRKDKQRITVDIYTARPGIVIGKSGVEVDALRKELHAITGKSVHININEIKRPELDAQLVAQSIAEQLQNRVSFRRAMKRSLASAMRSGAQGIKIQCGGRLGGGEMSRSERYTEGRIPLHTIRADIDYGFAEAKTTYGRIGVKVWVNKGEIMPEGYEGTTTGKETRLGDQDQARRKRGGAAEGLGASREGGRGRGQDREGLGLVQKRRRGPGGGQGGGGGRPGGRPPGGGSGGRGRGSRPAGQQAEGQQGGGRPPQSTPMPEQTDQQAPETTDARRRPTPAPRGLSPDVAPTQDQAPKAVSRPSRRVLPRADDRAVRRLWDQGPRGRLDHEPPDRGGPDRDDPQDPPRRQGVDQRLPGQAVHEEAGRDPDGFRQRLARGMGRGRQARPRDVRARRRLRGAGAGSPSPRRAKAAREGEVRETGG